ncbi:MAG: tol-pal system protein YbgF [Desulfovibrionaceae bacterium]|nr:tol-pal system protein YbgF [Desulfovibrionaceae bacterium]
MPKSSFLTFGVALLSSALLTGCVEGRNPSLEEQVYQQDMQLKQLQPAQADTLNQLQSMRQELDELKGQLDDLKNVGGAQALVGRVNKHDAALRQVESSMAMSLDLGDPMAQTKPAPQASTATLVDTEPKSPVTGSYGQPLVAANTPEGVQPWNKPTPQASSSQPVTPPSESTWGKATPQEVQTPAPTKDLSLALYDAGLNAFNSRNYNEAQRSFSDFLTNYSTHQLVPDAQYYLAECYFQKNQFSDAALAYNEVITKYSKSSRAPGAYLKQGICFSKSGQKAAAQSRMNELIRKYPKSPEAARAKNFLKTNA